MAAATGNVLCRKVYSSSVLCARSVPRHFDALEPALLHGAGAGEISSRHRASVCRLLRNRLHGSAAGNVLCRKVYSSSVPCARSVSPSFRRLGAGSTSRSRRRRNLKPASSVRLPPAKKYASWQPQPGTCSAVKCTPHLCHARAPSPRHFDALEPALLHGAGAGEISSRHQAPVCRLQRNTLHGSRNRERALP